MDFEVLNWIHEPVLVIDKDFNVVFMNKKAVEIYGETDKKHCYEISHNFNQPCFHFKEHPCPINEILKSGKNHYGVVHKHYTKEGIKYFYVLTSHEDDYFIELHIELDDIFKKEDIIFDFPIVKPLFEEGKIVAFSWKNEQNWPVTFVSDNIKDILGFTAEDFIEGKILYSDLIHPDDLDRVIKEIEDVIKEKKKFWIHKPYRLKTKKGNFIWILDQITPIYDENGNITSFFGFVIDITREVRLQRLYKVLRNVNKAIITVLTEEELYKIICETLVKELDIKFVWIGVPDKETNLFKEVYKCGEEEGYLDVIKVAVGENLPEGRGPTGLAFRTGNIIINPDTKTTEFMKPWKEEMLKRNFLSSASIPIKKNDEVVATLNIYATEPFYFEEENKTILEELQVDLQFALEKIETIRNSIILKQAIENSSQWVLITDKDGNIEYVNDYVCEVSGYTKEELIGKNPRIFKSGYRDEKFYENLWNTIKNGEEFDAILVDRKKNGELFYIEEKIIPVKLPDGSLKFISIGRDITKEKILSEENERLRYHDVVTNLYNFVGFQIQVADYIIKNPDNLSALILIDIYNFSVINKKYGVEIGDEILKYLADILNKHFKKNDIVGRTGSDEFGIFLKDIKDKNNLLLIIERLKTILNEKLTFKLDGEKISIRYNIGISIYPDDGKSFKEIMESASIALKYAKEEGENVIKFHSKEMEEKIESLFKAENLLQKAVEKDLFIFHYQPYFDTKTGKIAGFESLVRIKDEDAKIYYPKDFIDLLEQSEYLHHFKRWALKEVSQKIKKWNIPISINISARSFKNLSLAQKVLEHAKDLPAPMVLEITERIYMENPEQSKQIIEELKKCKNIRISIDDFGTGYSSLSYLKDLDADVIKIDISFVRKMMEDEKTRIIVKTIIILAKELGMKTVAEGVETKEQYDMLKEMGVDYIQGFYLAKPMPEEEAEKLLKR